MARSGHIADLRRQVGTQRLLMPAASVLLFDERRRLLLLRHHDGDRWGTPGGAVEPGERPADAAVREVWEETGLHVELTALVGVFGGPDHEVVYDNGDRTAYVSSAFAARIRAGELRTGNDEIAEARWVSSDEIGAYDLPAYMAEIVAAGFAQLETLAPAAWFAAPRWSPPAG